MLLWSEFTKGEGRRLLRVLRFNNRLGYVLGPVISADLREYLLSDLNLVCQLVSSTDIYKEKGGGGALTPCTENENGAKSDCGLHQCQSKSTRLEARPSGFLESAPNRRIS